jgi:hypothetical protein
LTGRVSPPTLKPMRWDALFGDMEAQFAEDTTLAVEAEISERARVEAAAVVLMDRIRGGMGSRLAVHLHGGRAFEGVLSHAGAEALVLDERRHQVLIPYGSVAHYAGLGRVSLGETSQVRRRIGLAHALRSLARDRAALTLILRHSPPDGSGLTGVIDRVGADFLDLALVAPGEVRRASQVRQVATVPFGSLGAIRSWHAADL